MTVTSLSLVLNDLDSFISINITISVKSDIYRYYRLRRPRPAPLLGMPHRRRLIALSISLCALGSVLLALTLVCLHFLEEFLCML